jgi:hypothetical protein
MHARRHWSPELWLAAPVVMQALDWARLEHDRIALTRIEGDMNRTRAGIIGAALLTIGGTTVVSAAPALDQWPRQCRPDIGRVCHDVVTEDDRIVLTCLQENQKKLRQACRKLLQSYGHVPETTVPAKRRR